MQPYELTDVGKGQAKAAAIPLMERHLDSGGFWRIYSSDLFRAKQTTDILLKEMEALLRSRHANKELENDTSDSQPAPEIEIGQMIPKPEFTEMIRERAGGAKEDLSLYMSMDQAIQMKSASGSTNFELESNKQVAARARSFINMLLQAAHEDVKHTANQSIRTSRPVLMVSHGGFIRTLLSECGVQTRTVWNSSISVLHFSVHLPAIVSLECVSDVSHLEGCLQTQSRW